MLANRTKSKGQTLLEYILLGTVVIGMFLAISFYLKRGFQGRWKTAIDELGDQYDPRTSDARVTHRLRQNTVTRLKAVNTINGFWTTRTDDVETVETKDGFINVGGY